MAESRLNIAFSDRQHAALEQMAKELGTTKSGVIKTALALLEVAIRERKSGNQISVTRGDKVLKELIGILPGDDSEPEERQSCSEDRRALSVLAYMIRDQARKARDSRLQNDDDEFDRLLGLFNLPEDRLFDAVKREIDRE